jgi:hypothetical protein
MEDTYTCPKCQMENAYFNGVVFECPDCDYEWSDNSETIPSFDYSKEHSEFEELAKLKAPFFKLEHGKLYDCKVEHEKGIENISVIPLAFKKGKNLQFIMTDARRLFKENPNFVQEIIQMGYEYIYEDGIKADYPFDYSALTIICATRKDGSIVAYSDMVFFDFKRTDEV